MAKTKKKTEKTHFQLVLGNTQERAGHRRDCCQIAVRLVCKKTEVSEDQEQTPEGFLATCMEHLHDVGPFELEIWEGFVAEIDFNLGRVTAKDVKEVTP
jgi:hypothetical protein